jgi:2-hydroxymuconate-semialdehyde hydrolase
VSGAFAAILPFLAERFHLFAMDFIGFGRSGLKQRPPFFDFSLWVRQAEALAAMMPKSAFGIFGHSVSGAVALRLAARMQRVCSVITTGSAGTQYPLNEHLARLWTFPRSREELLIALRSLLFDPTRIPDTELDRRWAILGSEGYGDYFSAMFAVDKQALIDSWVLSEEELRAIRAPVTLVHGRNDLACPPELTSLRLYRQITHADLVLLGECAHAPAMEQPAKVSASVEAAFANFLD